MKKILISLAATAALAGAALPAAAQPWHGGYDRHPSGARYDMGYVDSLDWQLQNAAQQRRISWNEARQLRQQLAQVKPIAWRVQTGEASGWERQRLEATISRIQRAVNSYGYASRGDRYDRYDRDWRR